ncbi:MAG: NYN domain-containing protein [Treponema sp.]|nr:NYN domain-containing protein [Treponema sp.]
MKTAILVDGAYYRKLALRNAGQKSPEERAEELIKYCIYHLKNKNSYIYDKGKKYFAQNELYRFFYYDCEPSDKKIFHPLKDSSVDLSKQPTYHWTMKFFEELKKKRKLALRLGFLTAEEAIYILKQDTVKRLFRKEIKIEDVTENDFQISMKQKGVDMKIGLDIASLAYKKQVDQIVLIAGDSDFVPAAKLARREGIDFILDPMGKQINAELFEHIDGLRSYYQFLKNGNNNDDINV